MNSKLANDKIILDKKQQKLLKLLQDTAELIQPNTLFNRIKQTFSTDGLPAGVYLYGAVGRGKTMLMKLFYEQIAVPKHIVHYQKFMYSIHQKLHSLQNESHHKIIQEVASDLAQHFQVICMDEFEVKDITDAMIIMHLFKYLKKNNVFIFITTNTQPDSLYQHGLQRESFLPFIGHIKQHFRVLCLDNTVDYRYRNISKVKEKILHPINNYNVQKLQQIKHSLCSEDELAEVSIQVVGRELKFATAYQNILYTNFSELFERNISYVDYVHISEYFKIIVVEDIRKIHASENDIATRFINFVDNIYFNQVMLFMTIECPPNALYNGQKKNEFIRTISRLNEMNSDT